MGGKNLIGWLRSKGQLLGEDSELDESDSKQQRSPESGLRNSSEMRGQVRENMM